MKGNIYYIINLYNYIGDKIIHYDRKIANCITLLKYINKLFQNNYKIKDTNSIMIDYEEKELYYYYRNEGKNNIFINNIKLNIKECFKNKNEYKNSNKNIRKIKNNFKNRKIKKNDIKYNINEDFTKYIERINNIKRNLCKKKWCQRLLLLFYR